MNIVKILVIMCAACTAIVTTSCRKKDTGVAESEKAITLGQNGRIAFLPIADAVNANSYGFGTVRFDHLDKEFAIFSIPASGKEEETRFNMEITGGTVSKYYYCDMMDKNLGLSAKVAGAVSSFVDGNSTKTYEVVVSGTITPYQQTNFAVLTADTYNSDASASQFYEKIMPQKKMDIKENSAYLIAYPWRTISVAFSGEISVEKKAEIIEYANKTFRQAICTVVEASDPKVYDCKLIFKQLESRYNFLDEFSLTYNIHSSNRLESAEVDISPASGTLRKNAAFAIAKLLGLNEYDTDPHPGIKNLMDETGTENDNHLTFKQWNQLH